MGWLFKLLGRGFQRLASRQSEAQVRQLLNELRPKFGIEVALCLAYAAKLRNELDKSGELPRRLFEITENTKENSPGLYQMHFSARVFQTYDNKKRSLDNAERFLQGFAGDGYKEDAGDDYKQLRYENWVEYTAGRILLFSLRAITDPTLQPLVAELWKELKRGRDNLESQSVFDAAWTLSRLPGPCPNVDDCKYVPALFRTHSVTLPSPA